MLENILTKVEPTDADILLLELDILAPLPMSGLFMYGAYYRFNHDNQKLQIPLIKSDVLNTERHLINYIHSVCSAIENADKLDGRYKSNNLRILFAVYLKALLPKEILEQGAAELDNFILTYQGYGYGSANRPIKHQSISIHLRSTTETEFIKVIDDRTVVKLTKPDYRHSRIVVEWLPHPADFNNSVSVDKTVQLILDTMLTLISHRINPTLADITYREGQLMMGIIDRYSSATNTYPMMGFSHQVNDGLRTWSKELKANLPKVLPKRVVVTIGESVPRGVSKDISNSVHYGGITAIFTATTSSEVGEPAISNRLVTIVAQLDSYKNLGWSKELGSLIALIQNHLGHYVAEDDLVAALVAATESDTGKHHITTP